MSKDYSVYNDAIEAIVDEIKSAIDQGTEPSKAIEEVLEQFGRNVKFAYLEVKNQKP